MLSRQVSWLAGRRLGPAFPKQWCFSGSVEPQLAAYSCGGSAGIARRRTGFPLSLAPEDARTTTPADYEPASTASMSI
jgi:hypothetical protein